MKDITHQVQFDRFLDRFIRRIFIKTLQHSYYRRAVRKSCSNYRRFPSLKLWCTINWTNLFWQKIHFVFWYVWINAIKYSTFPIVIACWEVESNDTDTPNKNYQHIHLFLVPSIVAKFVDHQIAFTENLPPLREQYANSLGADQNTSTVV